MFLRMGHVDFVGRLGFQTRTNTITHTQTTHMQTHTNKTKTPGPAHRPRAPRRGPRGRRRRRGPRGRQRRRRQARPPRRASLFKYIYIYICMYLFIYIYQNLYIYVSIHILLLEARRAQEVVDFVWFLTAPSRAPRSHGRRRPWGPTGPIRAGSHYIILYYMTLYYIKFVL